MNEQLQPLETTASQQDRPQRNPGRYRLRAYLRGDSRTTPGTRYQVSEEALGEIFGVSHRIRRALSRLAHEGVVLLRPNRGAVVANPSVEEARQVFLARRLVERAITRAGGAARHGGAVGRVAADGQRRTRQLLPRRSRCRYHLSGEFHLRSWPAARRTRR